eukprot:393926_1
MCLNSMKKTFSRLPSAAASGYCGGVARNSSLQSLRGESVRIVEVGPRDGLQNEPKFLELNVKVELIRRLISAGVQTIETTAFVSPEKVPQLADADEVLSAVCEELPHMNLSREKWPVLQALVPNTLGLERALKAGVDEVSVFTAASETFCRKNINCSVAESLENFKPILKTAQKKNIPVRGYVSCALGCPYEGTIPKTQVAVLVEDLISMGCYEVSIADTIGVGTPADILNLCEAIAAEGILPSQMAVHFHNTYGQALANILTALDFGIRVVDTAIGGLGGCPFARGATGNVATEDVVYMLNGLGIETGIDVDALVDTTNFITTILAKPPQSSVAQAMLAKLEN